MSWPAWSAAGTPIPTAITAPVQSTLLSTTLNSAPAVIAPVSYNQEQWAQVQQQNWQQWAQWQQQYQQWHQQYGAEYQKSISSMQGAVAAAVQPPLPVAMAAAVAPPLPIENKPPLPPEDAPLPQPVAAMGYATSQPSSHQAGYSTAASLITQHVIPPQLVQPAYAQAAQNWQNVAQKRPHNQDPNYDHAKRSMLEKPANQWTQNQQNETQNQWQASSQNFSQPPPQISAPAKANVEELSEAEKKFDKEFAAWEAQFNKWKEQNANHPDKIQYKEYEKKWESWRNSLLERREQMRRKRLGLTGQTGTTTPKTLNNSPSITPANNNPAASLSLPGTKPSLLGHYTGTPVATPQINELFSKLPPTHNNEPLSFKSQTTPPEQDNDNLGEGFLKSSPSGGIPGLDLVKEDSKDENLPDRSDEVEAEGKIVQEGEEPQSVNKGPDFEAISKGINSILGDQKLMSMLSMVSQNPPNLTNVPVATTTTSAIPSIFAQNFAVPPPNLQQFPPTNVSEPPPPIVDTPYTDYSNQSHSNQEDYYQARETSNNFNNQGSRFDGPTLANNFERDVPRNIQDNFNTKPFEEKGNCNRGADQFNRSGDSFNRSGESFNRSGESFNRTGDNFNRSGDNFNRNGDNFNRFNNQFDNDALHNRNDNFHNDTRDNYNGSRGTSSFNRDNFGSQNQYGRTDKFQQDNYDDYDNYNDEDDYDKYNEMFKDEDEQYQDNYKGRRNDIPQQPQHKIAALMDQVAPAPPQIKIPFEDEELFEPTTVIDYEHKFKREYNEEVTVEPVNMFDYRHKPLNRISLPQRPKWLTEAVKFIREFDPMANRFERPPASVPIERYPGTRDEDHYKRFEGKERTYDRGSRNDRSFERDDFHYNDRRNNSSRDRLRFSERDDYRDDNFERSREERSKPNNSDKLNTGNRRKLASFSKDDFEDFSDTEMDFEHSEQVRHSQEFDVKRSKSKSPELSNPPNPTNNQLEITMIEDVINPPGRYSRPPRIVIILRGPPGSGKTFLAKQIKDKEVENGGSAPRILSLDDYFMVEQENKVLEDGKMQTVKKMVYEYEAEMEESYRTSFMKSFKKTVTDGYFPFIIVDNVNDKVKHFGEMWSFAKRNGFQVYICQMDLDPVQCAKRNIHNRTETEIEEIISGWEPTPAHHPTIDASGLLQMCAIAEVEMEVEDQQQELSDTQSGTEDQVRSKWDNFDCSSNNLAKLDGVNKPLRKSRTMEEYLQLEDQWEPPKSSTPGKKRVRWADLEEQRELEKMRAIGFVVGQTDWDRMMDPTGGRRALTQTKYIEKVSRYKHI